MSTNPSILGPKAHAILDIVANLLVALGSSSAAIAVVTNNSPLIGVVLAVVGAAVSALRVNTATKQP